MLHLEVDPEHVTKVQFFFICPIYNSSGPSHPTSRCCISVPTCSHLSPSTTIQTPFNHRHTKNQTYQPSLPLIPLCLPQKRNVHHFNPHFSPISLNLGHLHA